STALHPILHSFPTRRSSDLQQNILSTLIIGLNGRRLRQAGKDVLKSSRFTGIHHNINSRNQSSQIGDAACTDPRTHQPEAAVFTDRKSTRLNSSHVKISYAV